MVETGSHKRKTRAKIAKKGCHDEWPPIDDAARERLRRCSKPPHCSRKEIAKARLQCLRETGLPDLFFRTSKLQLPLPPPPKPLPDPPPPSLGYYDDDDDDDDDEDEVDYEDANLRSLREQLNRLRNKA